MNSKNILYENVMEKLKFDPFIDDSNITIAIKDNGVVVLGGTVKSYTEKYLAEEAVEAVSKVKGVANELVVDLASVYKRSDIEIVNSALNALDWTVSIPKDRVKVAVSNGHLTLTGGVEYNFQRERAQKTVQDLYGVTYVTNKIKIEPTVTPIMVKEKIVKEFERNAALDAKNIEIEVDHDQVTLKGSVKNFSEDREAVSIVWSIPGIRNVIDRLVVIS